MTKTDFNLISDDYKELNAQSHAENPDWGTSGTDWFDHIRALIKAEGATRIIDYGCGKGLLADMIEGLGIEYQVQRYDPAIAEFEDKPEKADLVICLDVLEHIEPDCLNDVLDHIASLAPKAFFVIATRAAKHKLPDGRNAHLIVAPAAWWREQLDKRFSIENHPVLRKRQTACLCRTR